MSQANPHQEYRKVMNAGRRTVKDTRKAAMESNASVVVKLSEGAVAISEVQGLQQLNPEDRAKRIEYLADAIHEGKYRVDSFLIARSILEGEKGLEMLAEGEIDEADSDAD